MAKIAISTGKRMFETTPSLYGLFFEDINRSGDGGLYPELLRNRAFDDGLYPNDLTRKEDDLLSESGWLFEYQMGEGQKKWKQKLERTKIPAWYCENATMDLDKEDILNEYREAAVKIDFAPGGSIYNVGFSGVSVKKDATYHVYFWAKAEHAVELICGIEKQDEIICSEKVVVQADEYAMYNMTLQAGCTQRDARFFIRSEKGGKIRLGFISMMPEDTYHGHGLRKDLCEKLEGLHPAFLRFPGGCIVEGFSKSTAHRFKRMVGPVWTRPGVLNLWGYRSTEGLGFHEYLQLCEDLQVDALYVCNCGMTCQARNCILMDEDEIQDLLDDVLCALEYALGDKETVWGNLRAQMGHPEPFSLRYLEIGNENNGKDYEERYEIFRKVISEKYPDIVIVANTHVEEAGLKLDIADEHFYDKTEWFAENTHYYDKYDRKGPGIFVGEFAVVAGHIRTLYAALGEAMFMVGLERNQDIVKLAAYAPLFENVNYAAWEPNLIAFDGLDNYAIPSYYVWKLFAENKGKYVLESSQESKTVYAPYLKGGPCIIGSVDVKFRNATWNGEEVSASKEIFGRVKQYEDGVYTTEITPGTAEEERAKRFGMEGTVLITMSEDEHSRAGSFEIEMLAEEGKELGIGMFATPYGKARNSEDSPWNLFAVQPIRWTIAGGKSMLTAGVGFRRYQLAEPIALDVEMNAYHKMKMLSDGQKLHCMFDDVCVMTVELPHYDAIQSVVLEDEEEIVVKIVNIADKEAVEVTMDCEVESTYKVGVITGSPMDCNTLQEPEKVREHWSQAEGAKASFIYEAPANSVNVLRLKKK